MFNYDQKDLGVHTGTENNDRQLRSSGKVKPRYKVSYFTKVHKSMI